MQHGARLGPQAVFSGWQLGPASGGGGGGSGGVRLGLVSVGADGRLEKGDSHRLRLKLDVRDTVSGDQATVSDRR